MHNLLRDPLFHVRLPGKVYRAMTLPAILAQLSCDEIESFTALQPHQSHAWHAFLVQLAAITISSNNDPFNQALPEAWLQRLLELTYDAGDEAAWHLINSELSQPAFMQPPVPENSLNDFKNISSPDLLDVLWTSKNHDVKQRRIANPKCEHWVYALISLQTMQGYSGSGNYGIVRMNAGYASRPCVTYSPSHNIGERFRRDVRILCNRREQIVNDYQYLSKGGLGLLWLLPWDGHQSLGMHQLDPFFIEICRRIRLINEEKIISANFKPSSVLRLQGKELQGNTGDPWTPKAKSGKSLTITEKGFSYDVAYKLIFQSDYQPGILQQIQNDDPNELYCIMQGLTRGDGITEGFHERHLLLPAKFRGFLSNINTLPELSQLAKSRIEDAAKFGKDVLRLSLLRFFQAGSKDLNFKDKRMPHITKYMQKFDADVDSIFFPFLWEHLEMAPDESREKWLVLLKKMAWKLLQDVISQYLVDSAQYYKAVAQAEKMFHITTSKIL